MLRSPYTQVDRWRDYSSLFSRRVFSDVMKFDDFTRFTALIERYDKGGSFVTYYDYIRYAYKHIAKDYRCEYVYKNEIINQLLLKHLGTKNAIAINEFRVNGSIVDLALFNGESSAYEIKTEYDNQKRLAHQLDDYSKLFQKCYVVVPEKSWQEYMAQLPKKVGIISLKERKRGSPLIYTKREATSNLFIDVEILMRTLRTAEYQNIVEEYYGELPDVSCYEMFDSCEELMKQIPQSKLSEYFLKEIKKRYSCTPMLRSLPLEVRQMCLAMNLNEKQTECLCQKLNNKMI